MTAQLAITAFDHTTSKITITGHGLTTGTGPCALLCVGGVLPAGPGFAPVTDYFVINVDANTIQLASSSTNANNGVPITFADNGTGTTTLLVGIPFRRPRTHVGTVFNLDGTVQTPGTQIKSADLNDNYDAWSAAYALLTGQPQTLLDSPTFAGNLTVGGALLPFADFTFTATGGSPNLVATAHKLHTGAGPVQTSNSGGGLPGGLAAATPYFSIKIDNNTFQLATTQANALAGIPITPSTSGTGTQTINHQPMTARITDVTVTRNLIVGNKASAAAHVLSSPQNLFYGGSDFIIDGGAPTRAAEVWTFASASTQVIMCSLRLLPGTVISDLVWSYNRTTSTLAFELLRRSFGDGGATSGTVSTTTVAAGTGATSVAASASGTGMPHTVADGFLYFLRVSSSSVATFDGVKLLIDRR